MSLASRKPSDSPRKNEPSRTRYEEAFRSISAAPAPVGKPAAPVAEESILPPIGERALFMRYLRLIAPFRWRLAFVFGISLTGVLIGLTQPLLTRYLVDSVVLSDGMLSGEKFTIAVMLGAIALLLLAASSIAELVGSFALIEVGAQVVTRTRRLVFDRFLQLPLQLVERIKTGGFTCRLVYDTEAIAGLLGNTVVQPLVLGVRIAVTLVLIFWVNWKLALFATLAVPPSLAFSFLATRRMHPLYRIVAIEKTEMLNRMSELFRGIRVLKIYNRESRERLRLALDSHFIARVDLIATKMQRVMEMGWNSMLSMAALVIICVGSILTISGAATMGDVIALSLYTTFVLQPIFQLVNCLATSKRSTASLERIFQLLEAPSAPVLALNGRKLVGPVSSIEFDNVWFSYNVGQPVLKGVSFAAKRGETVAFVGKSGAGKSTVLDLLSRFYAPDSGEIRANGIDVGEYDLREYRSQFAIVEQDVTLFDGTIGENIAYGYPGATQEEIEAAARAADAHDFVMSLPDGYDTTVGENGSWLSGGQKQRVSIARAFLTDPKILILDEATSNLDSETESSVQRALKHLIQNRITFIIAHRMSTIRDADQIIVMHDGEIVETGRHAQLVSFGGRYFNSVKNQMNVIDDLDAAVV